MINICEIENIEYISPGTEFILFEDTCPHNKSKGRTKHLTVKVSSNGCWEVTSHALDSGGYGQFKHIRTHVLSYKKYIGDIEQGLVVRHMCDNPKCCNPFHLEIGTTKDNLRDMLDRHGNKKYISKELAIEIAKDYDTTRNLIKKYDVTKDIVYHIKLGSAWEFYTKNVLVGIKPEYEILSEDDIKFIYESNLSPNKLSKIFNRDRKTLWSIKKGKTYKSITENLIEGYFNKN